MILQHETENQQQSSTNAWNLQVGRDVCSDINASLDHEWLVTNGIGGYASGSIAGTTTRCYHGLLVASLHPPVERTVMVTKVDEEVLLPDGRSFSLGVNEYQGGVIDPRGNVHLESVSLEGDIVCFVYRLTEMLTLEKRVWMEYGQNTTYVQYMLRGIVESEQANTVVTLTLIPFCLYRDYHATTKGSGDWQFAVDNEGSRCQIRAFDSATPYQLVAGPSASFTHTGIWYWRVAHRRDTERGLADHEDVYQPGMFDIALFPGHRTTLVISAETKLPEELGGLQHEEVVTHAMMRHQRRIRQLLSVANNAVDDLQQYDPVRARLVMAADQFIVARPDYANMTAQQPLKLTPDRKTIIAGYPWFTDWGRDSMIALPGLLLSTGRYSEARGLLKAFVSFAHNGLIPNRFPDNGEAPEYNTADATLWLFHALDRYLAVTGDWTLLKELFPALQSIIDWHVRGTDFGIGVDPADGLLRAGASGVQLTWMDAKVDGVVITPRRGKPVEINALWYAALTSIERWSVHLSTDATSYSQLRTQIRQNFAMRFWNEETGYLYDVIDVEGVSGQNDASLRPNQLFAASLTHELLSEAHVASMFQHVKDSLFTPFGLRSLSPSDPVYRNHFKGNAVERDSAYHQGTVWPWLVGAYVDVCLRIHNDKSALQPLLQPLIERLWYACLGTISEVAEPNPPYTPGGCYAQAWSVAELLRCWLLSVES
ncbi:MAG: amylo-alpha-1,6-glucosidase [Ktedonobacteraceae bacterium]